eukprot:TRINITY_DN2542_c0_g1_i1.p1 TRINITY_DN2542_c0_g1~~TRINITY_DN2542_c0_g1_i1.p1  ORF type:complete len:402 (+),score=87.00 TRINITY_DN2542_c0_g1_i1:333-1538(+)
MNSRLQVIDPLGYKWMKGEDENEGLSPLLHSPFPASPPPTPTVSPSTPSVGITMEEFARLMQIQLLNEPSFIEANIDSDNDFGVDAQGMQREILNKDGAQEEINVSQNESNRPSPGALFSLSPPEIVVYSEDLEILERSITNAINKEKEKEDEFEKNSEYEDDGSVSSIDFSVRDYYTDEDIDELTPSVQMESPSIFSNSDELSYFGDSIWYNSAIEENLHQLQKEQGIFPPIIYANYNFPSLPDMTVDSPYNRSHISYAPTPQFVRDKIKAKAEAIPSPSFSYEGIISQTPSPFEELIFVNNVSEKPSPSEKKKTRMRKSQSAPNISAQNEEEIESPHLSCKRIRLSPTKQTPSPLSFWNEETPTSFLAEMFDNAIPPTHSFFPTIPNYTRYIKPYQNSQ